MGQTLFIRSCQPILNYCIMKFLLVALCSLAMASAIEVEICDPEITEAHFDNLDIAVDPDPIIVEAGKQVGLHFAIDLLNQINGGTVKIDIVSGILPVPCLEVEGHKVGSCEYTTEKLRCLLSTLRGHWKLRRAFAPRTSLCSPSSTWTLRRC